MAIKTLNDLYLHQLKDLYSACKQSMAIVTEMGRAAKSRELSEALIAGNQGFTWRGTAPGGAGTAWAGTSGTDTLVYFNTDADAVAEMTIRILDGAVVASAYTSGDFVL